MTHHTANVLLLTLLVPLAMITGMASYIAGRDRTPRDTLWMVLGILATTLVHALVLGALR